MNGFLLFLIILNVYIVLVYFAARSGLLARFNVGLMGPALMFRTNRGKGIIEWISKARQTWIVTGTWGIWLVLGTMFAMTLLLIVQVPLLFRIPEEQAPSANQILALPGINPLIPLSYGIIALIVAIVIHEFAHGVLARAQQMKVKSLGMLYLIVPIGAFVEPDEEQLMASSRKERMRVYAAGPTSNIVTTLICGLIFSVGFVAGAAPVADGVGVLGTVDNSPAEQGGLEAGMIMTHIDGAPIPDAFAFRAEMANTTPGQRVTVDTAEHGSFSFCLASGADATNGEVEDRGAGYDYCQLYNATAAQDAAAARSDNNTTNDDDWPIGFMGVEPFDPAIIDRLAHPLSSVQNAVLYVALPFTGLTPIDGAVADMFTTPWADTLGDTAYWVTANLFYWVMWISLMLGLTNALPAVPLDGGFLFRDFVESVLAKVRATMSDESRARFAKRTSVSVSFLILGLILLQFIAPRLAGWFGLA